jgi:hypothetical protein
MRNSTAGKTYSGEGGEWEKPAMAKTDAPAGGSFGPVRRSDAGACRERGAFAGRSRPTSAGPGSLPGPGDAGKPEKGMVKAGSREAIPKRPPSCPLC